MNSLCKKCKNKKICMFVRLTKNHWTPEIFNEQYPQMAQVIDGKCKEFTN
jgi:hypothetical protein